MLLEKREWNDAPGNTEYVRPKTFECMAIQYTNKYSTYTAWFLCIYSKKAAYILVHMFCFPIAESKEYRKCVRSVNANVNVHAERKHASRDTSMSMLRQARKRPSVAEVADKLSKYKIAILT